MDDEGSMRKTGAAGMAEERSLNLVATCAGAPKAMLEPLSQAVVACRGWVLAQGEVSPRCADMDFEFSREHAVEIYGLLVGMGVELSTEAHGQLTCLCQRMQHADPDAAVRVYLTLYAAEGSESFLGSGPRTLQEAA